MTKIKGSRPRSRGPSREKTRQTAQAIVEAALACFTEAGFSKTKMEDVAGRAGVAKGTLYLYFKDKNALFEGVLKDAFEHAHIAEMTLSSRKKESAQDFFSRLSKALVQTQLDPKRIAIIRLMIAEGRRFPKLSEIYYRVVISPATATIRTRARKAYDDGEIPTDTLALFPQLFVAPAIFGIIWNGLFGSKRLLNVGKMYEAYLEMAMGKPIGRGRPTGRKK